MLKIQQVTNDTRQRQTLTLPDGTALTIEMYFVPMQYCWFIEKLTYLDFEVNGLKISNNLNILRQFKNQIPFGLACISVNDREPSFQDDFSTGASTLYILTAEEVEAYEDYLRG